MPGAFQDSKARVVARRLAQAADEGLYPNAGTLNPIIGSSRSLRWRVLRAADQRPFDRGPGLIATAIERNAVQQIRLPPGEIVRLGDRLTVTAPADQAGLVMEVVEPISPNAVGYRVGLSHVSGNR